LSFVGCDGLSTKPRLSYGSIPSGFYASPQPLSRSERGLTFRIIQ
jgi:hypothetical protein